MRLGEKLKYLREERGMSQSDLAEQLLVSRQTISKWEKDQSLPDLENVKLLSQFFEVSYDYLLDDDMDTISKASAAQAKLPVYLDKRFIYGSFVAGLVLVSLSIVLSYLLQYLDYQLNGSFYTQSTSYLGQYPLLYPWILGIIFYLYLPCLKVVLWIRENLKKYQRGS